MRAEPVAAVILLSLTTSKFQQDETGQDFVAIPVVHPNFNSNNECLSVCLFATIKGTND